VPDSGDRVALAGGRVRPTLETSVGRVQAHPALAQKVDPDEAVQEDGALGLPFLADLAQLDGALGDPGLDRRDVAVPACTEVSPSGKNPVFSAASEATTVRPAPVSTQNQ
jgi:hypothetical protein